MGLLKSGINEVIATTACNAAPIGIHLREKKATVILFRGSHTATNIERDGWIIANLIHDPVMYVRTAFEDLPPEDFVEEVVDGKTMQRLNHADAWAAYSAEVTRGTSETIIASLTLKKEIVEKVSVHPVNRGFGNLIDATVYATRFRITRDPELKNLIDYHAGIVRKCGGKRELEALDLLLAYCK